ncbi:MAG: aryl-sulfate sulfotransferase [Croceibacterium sp.]
MRPGWVRRCAIGGSLALAGLAAGPMAAAPTVFPTGTTIYQPDKTWNGFTVLSPLGTPAVIVVDMNGRVVKRWEGFDLVSGGPARVLPGGVVVAPQGDAMPQHLEARALVAEDFAGKELWRYDHGEAIDHNGKPESSGRQHHDWQLADFPSGAYSPQFTPALGGSNLLLLTHSHHADPAIADVGLDDDKLVELDPRGRAKWEWRAGDHIDEFHFTPAVRAAIRRGGKREGYDWFHMNSAAYLGPNKWFDAGDKRFDPDNVVISSRQASVIAIVARDGKIVWQLGPDSSLSPAAAALGQIIGQHDMTMIPEGLPGAGNLLLFDNGGAAGYGDPSPISPNGDSIYQRATSRVLEIDPVTLKLVWSYAAPTFYSFNISGAQRLPNGNTLITEGTSGRVFEVAPKGDIVWEYVAPPGGGPRASNALYRAYRIPYAWLPQVAKPTEVPIARPDSVRFHVPGTPAG